MIEAMVQNPETEVSPKAQRRLFTAAFKQRILEEAEACKKPGELGALLRREGVYSSCFSKWRRKRNQGGLDALVAKRRGPVPVKPDARDQEVAELKKALAKAEARAKRAEALVEVQKKVAELIGMQLPKNDEML
jgi:transposase-like protein